MIVPSSLMVAWLAAWLERTLGVHALGAAGALVIIAGAIVAVADAEAGLAAVAAGTDLLRIGWGLTDPRRPAIAVATPPADRLGLPAPPGEPPRPAWFLSGSGEAHAA